MKPRLLLVLYLLIVEVFPEEVQGTSSSDSRKSTLLSIWGSFFQDSVENELSNVETAETEQDSGMLLNLINEEEISPSSNEITNITQITRTKHVCVPYEGCTPPLNCTDFTNFNDSNLEGMVNQGHAVGVNLTQLQYLLENITHVNTCVIVMFYATWCPYSIGFGPVFNKLGLVFPQLPVVAFDFGLYSPDRYLLAYVPRVILYYSGRVVYDIETTMEIEDMTTILSNMTGLPSNAVPTDEEMINYISPIPTELVDDNYVLLLAIVAVVTIIGGNCVLKSDLYAKCKQKLLHLKED